MQLNYLLQRSWLQKTREAATAGGPSSEVSSNFQMPAVPEALKEGLFKALNSYSLPTFILSEEATPAEF